jgi:UDP-glucose 4-epimerase
MNHLILGGAGFIGQHLAKTLFKRDLRQTGVTVIDNLKTSNHDNEYWKQYKNIYRFIEADVTEMDDNELIRLIQKHHRVYHFAGSVGVEYIDKDPSGTLSNNLALNNRLIPIFKAARRHVVFSSTSEIYGNGPFNEDDNASIGPSSKLRWGYAASKLMMEFQLRAENISHTTVRFFNVVGPGQLGDYGMVLPRMINAAKKNEDIVVYGDGKQIRSFCHVEDAVNGLLSIADCNGEIFNIGNDQPISIGGLAERVIELSGSSSKIVYVPYEQAFSKNYGDIIKRVPDLTKIKAVSGYQPRYSLDDIIKDML